ncbi:MAG: glycosyl hydrolase [Anaerolineae bacterium]|nr:glycosyl hydrolase [Anaerolineae bacterium]MDW8100300.1 glycosyl hydrolase [Anaerolineae bacterium]
MKPATEVPAPLFRDPIYDGAADPTIIWNYVENTWWIVYTQRRANVDVPGVAWVHGTDIGVASSADGGRTWIYRGVLQGLEFERGHNTFWAPEILWHAGQYHMYVSYVPGVPHDWSGPRHIIHYTSSNLWDWQYESVLPLSSDRVIDACVHQLPDGRWRLWYKDEVHQSHTYAADSSNLYEWTVVGPVITDCSHEGPNVFQWRGYYWMVVDHWKGLGVYRSEDCERWIRQEDILGDIGMREDDGARGHHADVLVQGDDAYIFYFTHPQENETVKRTVSQVIPYAHRRTSLQVAKLNFDGVKLTCDRNMPFRLELKPPFPL